MTIITKPSIITKNEAAQFTLNKTDLSNHASVIGNAYFHDTTNWKEVIIKFVSTTGNQIEVLVFDCSIASPVANFLVSDKARNGFEINHITIMDHDGGSLHVDKAALNMAEFNVTVSNPVVPVTGFYSRDFSSPNTFYSYESSLQQYYSSFIETSSIVSNVLLFNPSISGEFVTNPTLAYTQGSSYKFRIYIAQDSQVPLSLSFQLGEQPGQAHSFSGAEISAAKGGFLEYTFTATQEQQTQTPFIRLIKNDSNSSMSVSKLEVIKL